MAKRVTFFGCPLSSFRGAARQFGWHRMSLMGHRQVVVPTVLVVESTAVLMEYQEEVQVQQDIRCIGHYP